jgi:hypothetical protein
MKKKTPVKVTVTKKGNPPKKDVSAKIGKQPSPEQDLIYNLSMLKNHPGQLMLNNLRQRPKKGK